jgi:hypothetical protein
MKKQSCADYIRQTIARNRARTGAEAFSEAERDALRERLATLAPDREKTQATGTTP